MVLFGFLALVGLFSIYGLETASASSESLAKYESSYSDALTETNVVTRLLEYTTLITDHHLSYVVVTSGTVHPTNSYLHLENMGQTAIVHPKIVVNDRPDWSTIDSMLDEILLPGMSDAEKARAIWQFARTQRYHYGPISLFTSDAHDPVRLFNVYGYGFCSDVAISMAALFERAGLPSRVWSLGNSAHVVSEAYYDGDWHMFDADLEVVYLERDGRSVAGVEDLVADPELIARTGTAEYGYLYLSPQRWNHPGANLYHTGHAISITLRPRESIQLNWQATGAFRNDNNGQNPSPPPVYANGQIVSHLDAEDINYREWLVSESNTRSTAGETVPGAITPVDAEVPGELVYRIDSPYPVTSAQLAADFYRTSLSDTVRIYVSAEDPIQTVDTYMYMVDWFSMLMGRYYLPGFVSENNTQVTSRSLSFPPLHSAVGGEPTRLIYRVTPARAPDTHVQIGGVFYRGSEAAINGIWLSPDGITWMPVWNSSQLGYVEHVEDVTSLVADWDTFYVKYEFISPHVGYINPSSVGLSAIKMLGIESAEQPYWMSDNTHPIGDFSVDIDVSPAIVPPDTRALYRYYVWLKMKSGDSPLDIGLTALTITTDVQIAPRSLPGLKLGANSIAYSDQSTNPTNIKITHSWTEMSGVYPPSPPSSAIYPADGAQITETTPLTLTWMQATDQDGGLIANYHIMLCDRQDCMWPLSLDFAR